MASIAGYKAVLLAAQQLPRYFPMMITSAGSIRPCKSAGDRRRRSRTPGDRYLKKAGGCR